MSQWPDAETEKRWRVYYQNIVYNICSQLDSVLGRNLARGEGIVCGTETSPTTQVQDTVKSLISELRKAREDAARLREAARPFAVTDPMYFPGDPDHALKRCYYSVGNLRRLKAAVEGKETPCQTE